MDEDQMYQLQANLKPKVVVILTRDRQGITRPTGGGVYVGGGDVILTVDRVIANQQHVYVRDSDGQQLDAQVVSRNPGIDLALLRVIPKGNRDVNLAITFAEEDSLKVGDDVFSLQHSSAIPYSFARGTIAYPCDESVGMTYKLYKESVGSSSKKKKKREDHDDLGDDTRLVAVHGLRGYPGCWGCPVVDSHGNLAGVHSFSKPNGVFSYLIHPSVCRQFWNDYLQGESGAGPDEGVMTERN